MHKVCFIACVVVVLLYSLLLSLPSDCKISTDGVNSISKMIASGCVEHLDLSENVISTEGLGFLCKAIKCNHSLKSLELRNCSITEIGARMLSEAIKSGTSLSFLDLSNNKIGDMGIYFLSEGICSSPFFNQLYVKSIRFICLFSFFLE